MRNRADQVSGFFWLIFSVFVSIESYRLGLGSLNQPGSGFFFFWASIALCLMSVFILIRAWLGKDTEETSFPIFGGRRFLKISLVLISVFLYAFFMETLGFILVTFLLFLFLLGVIEKKKAKFTVFVSIVVTAAAYLIFEICLKSQLPRGLLGF